MIVSASEQGGKLDHMESRLLDNVFDFADRVAREVMVPRQDMVCLYVEDSFEKNIAKVMATRHTRYPLVHEDKDHVLGVVHVRSLINIKDSEKENFDMRSRMSPIMVVPHAFAHEPDYGSAGKHGYKQGFADHAAKTRAACCCGR